MQFSIKLAFSPKFITSHSKNKIHVLENKKKKKPSCGSKSISEANRPRKMRLETSVKNLRKQSEIGEEGKNNKKKAQFSLNTYN